MRELLEQLNGDIWRPFVAAYAKLDLDGFLALYADDVVRVGASRGVICDRAGMAEEMGAFFRSVGQQSDLLAIDFRFDERLVADGLASERGVFRIVVNPKDGPARATYGWFHTIARKQGDGWRFTVDYDRTDATEDDFTRAAAIDDLDRFVVAD